MYVLPPDGVDDADDDDEDVALEVDTLETGVATTFSFVPRTTTLSVLLEVTFSLMTSRFSLCHFQMLLYTQQLFAVFTFLNDFFNAFV